MNIKSSFRRMFFIPLIVGGLFAALDLFGALDSLENKVYDLFLHWKPAVKESPRIVLLDVDEEAIEKTASWPWPRGLVAKGLETLSELGADYIVFDIEYNERSPMSVDREYYDGPLKADFASFFGDAGSNIGGLFGAIANGNIPLRDAAEYGNQLVDMLNQGEEDLYKKAGRIAIENDSYLGRAMRLFGDAFVTVNLQKAKIEPPLASRKLAEERFSVTDVTFKVPPRTQAVDFISPIADVTSMAAGAGFTNVAVDTDGVRRRIRLVEEIDGKAYLQLAFSPVRHFLGNPALVLRGGSLLLKGAVYDGNKVDVSIPLDENGNMLIRWPQKRYFDSFAPHVSFYRLLEYRNNEEILVRNLRDLQTMEGWALLAGANPVANLVTQWDASEDARRMALDSGSASDRDAWLGLKASFKSSLTDFLAQGYDAKMHGLLGAAKEKAKAADGPLYDDLSNRFDALYSNCAAAKTIIDNESAAMRKRLQGAYCIVGWTATATTDIGTNPFDESFVNVGTHAAIANGILQRDFLSSAPRWIAALEALLFAFAGVFLAARFPTSGQIAVGIAFTLLVGVGNYLVFHYFGVWSAVLAPTLATFLSFLVYALLSFILESREKNFLRKAFSTYLSGDVISEIVADPSLLKLGGQQKWITAVFTDVKGFSTISEKLSPEQLVHLLNVYLSGMSDIVLDHRGTIDKYEGDAIISFFGAPVTFEEHAAAACRSAILMKRREAELNQRFMAEGLSPTPLLTRIGINTGDMVVGNMGTDRKMNYTIMGNAVNLAARLEGVNKQYGSWILASDDTKASAGEEFVTRRFDKVRVVGIHTPVQLWEIVDFRADIDATRLDFLDRFETAHRAFDERDWKGATALFGSLVEESPADGPSATYKRRAEEFLAKPPDREWDGVLNLTEK